MPIALCRPYRCSSAHTRGQRFITTGLSRKHGIVRTAVPDTTRSELDTNVDASFKENPHIDKGFDSRRAHQTTPQSASASLRFAYGNPRVALRETLCKPSFPGGKIGGWLTFFSIILLLCKAIIFAIVRRTRNCKHCKGYGVTRCTLCGGSGTVSWCGKWNHIEPCPGCMGMRFHKCKSCGGRYQRPLFQHVSRNAGLQASQDIHLTTVDVISPLVD